MALRRLKARRMRLSDLALDEGNPRTMTKEARAALKSSIERFGLVQPIVLNGRTGRVVGGHQRIAALLEIGEEEVDVVMCDLDEAQERALNVALNSEELQGEWDLEMLSERLAELRDEIDGVEFDDLQFDALKEEVADLMIFASDADGLDRSKSGESGDRDRVPVSIGEMKIYIDAGIFGMLDGFLQSQWDDDDVPIAIALERVIVAGIDAARGE